MEIAKLEVAAPVRKQRNSFAAAECRPRGPAAVEEHHAGARAANKGQDT